MPKPECETSGNLSSAHWCAFGSAHHTAVFVRVFYIININLILELKIKLM